MRAIGVLLVALLVPSLFGAALAEPVERIQIEDPAGDANYLNDQFGPFLGSVNHGDVEAVNVIPQADILDVRFSHDKKTVTAQIHLAAALPSPVPLQFLVKANPVDAGVGQTGCAVFSARVAAGEEEDLTASGGDCFAGLEEATATVLALENGSGFVYISVPRKHSGMFSPGLTLVDPRASTQQLTEGYALPTVDQTKTGDDYKLD